MRPDEHLVTAGGVGGQRVGAGAGIVDHDHPRGGGEDLAAASGLELVAGLEVDRLRVADDDGHAHAGGG